MFAQLTVNGKWEGPHVFVVRLRDGQGRTLPGVRIKDNGHKAGLNGVDNGQIWWAACPLLHLELSLPLSFVSLFPIADTGCIYKAVWGFSPSHIQRLVIQVKHLGAHEDAFLSMLPSK